jgi:hypothetical protein
VSHHPTFSKQSVSTLQHDVPHLKQKVAASPRLPPEEAPLRCLTLALGLVAACGSTPAPAPSAPATPPPPPEPATEPVAAPSPGPAPCLPAGEPWLNAAWYAEGVVELCLGGESQSCFGFDLATRALTPVPAPSDQARVDRALLPGVERLDAAALEAAGNRHSVCASDRGPCREVTLGEGRVEWRSFSADGAMVVYSLTPSEPDAQIGRRGHAFVVFEVATGKLLKRHTFKDDSLICGGARFVGDLLFVAVDLCAGPAGVAWFMDPKTGRRLGDVGGPGPFGQYQPAVWLRERDVVVLEQTGLRLSVHDRRTGAYLRTVTLATEGELATEPYGNGLFPLPDGDALVTLTGESLATVLRVDGTTLAVRERVEAPRCPAPPAP